jgi:glyoxylase I family protein
MSAATIYGVATDADRPQVAGVHHLGLSVTDLDRSTAFYCDVLGAHLVRAPYDGDNQAFSGRMAIVGLGGFGIDLFEHADNNRDRFDPRRTGLDHLGIPVASVEELAAWVRWLDERGVAHSPVRDMPVGAMIDFVDPDGIQLEVLFIDRERFPLSEPD